MRRLSSPTRDWTCNVWIGNWQSLSSIQLAATPWTVQCMEFSSPPALRDQTQVSHIAGVFFFTSWARREALWIGRWTRNHQTTTGDPWAWLLKSSLHVTLDNNHCPAWRPRRTKTSRMESSRMGGNHFLFVQLSSSTSCPSWLLCCKKNLRRVVSL